MKNLTVTLDEQTYRAARVEAAEQGISVSALVRRLLAEVKRPDSRAEAIQRSFAAMDSVKKFKAGNRLTREELHER